MLKGDLRTFARVPRRAAPLLLWGCGDVVRNVVTCPRPAPRRRSRPPRGIARELRQAFRSTSTAHWEIFVNGEPGRVARGPGGARLLRRDVPAAQVQDRRRAPRARTAWTSSPRTSGSSRRPTPRGGAGFTAPRGRRARTLLRGTATRSPAWPIPSPSCARRNRRGRCGDRHDLPRPRRPQRPQTRAHEVRGGRPRSRCFRAGGRVAGWPSRGATRPRAARTLRGGRSPRVARPARRDRGGWGFAWAPVACATSKAGTSCAARCARSPRPAPGFLDHRATGPPRERARRRVSATRSRRSWPSTASPDVGLGHVERQRPGLPGAAHLQPGPHRVRASIARGRRGPRGARWRARPLAAVPLQLRMTGCPNGCARPALAEVGVVGRTKSTYDVYLGGGTARGSPGHALPGEGDARGVPALLGPLFDRWGEEANRTSPSVTS